MKKTYTTLLLLFILSICGRDVYAQFVVAQDTVRGRIDFCNRPADMNNATIVPNGGVFYMFPVDLEIDPWRYVDYYLPSGGTKRGYIDATKLMRVDDYEMIEVERISSHGTVSFKDSDVRANVVVTSVTAKDTSIKSNSIGEYIVNGKSTKGVAKWKSPKLRYQSISVSIKGKSIVFPKATYEHLLNPEIDNMAIYYNPEKEIVYVLANNGGEDAYYNVLWVVTAKGVENVCVFDPAVFD